MFKSEGRRRFEDCQNKQVTAVMSEVGSRRIRSLELVCLRAQSWGTSVIARAIEEPESLGVTYDKYVKEGEKGESNRAVYTNLASATRSLGKLAGKVICATCPFSQMSPDEANFHQASYNNALADRLESEKRLREITQQVQQTPPQSLGNI